jgi:release factor glutamine methyltransferase
MTLKEALLTAQNLLINALKAGEERLEAHLLMQHVLNVNRAWLIVHENDTLQPKMHSQLDALLNRRLKGEPIAYILGYREFYGLKLIVTPDTLIPRADTETLVEMVLAKVSSQEKAQILDLGTGCGAIGLAIAVNRPQAKVIAIDASPAALNIAIKNAKKLNINNVEFKSSDWFDALQDVKFNVIVSNPPYIDRNDAHLNQGDLRFEPLSALASGDDGLDDIRIIINESLAYLNPQGWLMLEHGYNQAETVADLMAQAGLIDIETIKDLGGNDRVTIGKNPLIVSLHWG